MKLRRFVKPAEGRVVRDPAIGNKSIPAHGAGVEWDGYWQRRLNDGDIEMTDEASVLAGEKAADKAAAKAADKPAGKAGDQGDGN